MALKVLPGPLHVFIIWVLHWEIQETHTSACLIDKDDDTADRIPTQRWLQLGKLFKWGWSYTASIMINTQDVQSIHQTGYSRGKTCVTVQQPPVSSSPLAQKFAPLLSCFAYKSHQINYLFTGLHDYQEKPTPQKPSLSVVSLHWVCQALLKSVPVSWARMRKERDWVVPVRGCQSSVSWISLFLLRSLGIKQGRFSTLRLCLHPGAAHGGRRLTQAHLQYPLTSPQLIRWPWNRGHPDRSCST